jgi:hypothetical protein
MKIRATPPVRVLKTANRAPVGQAQLTAIAIEHAVAASEKSP